MAVFRDPEDWEIQACRGHPLPSVSLNSRKEVSVVSARSLPTQSKGKFRVSVQACPTPALWMLVNVCSRHSRGRAGREAGRG